MTREAGHALRVGDVTKHGRIVAIQEPTEHLRGYAWVERQCPDGTVEREAIYLDELETIMSTEHAWVFLSGHGEDAPGKSLDTYEQCSQCGALRHDYRHGGGQTSPNYPAIYKYGGRLAVDAPCLGLLGAARSTVRVSNGGERP